MAQHPKIDLRATLAAVTRQKPADEPLEAIAARGRRKALIQAERALDEASTPADRAASVLAFERALKMNGLDGANDKPVSGVSIIVEEAEENDVAGLRPADELRSPAAEAH